MARIIICFILYLLAGCTTVPDAVLPPTEKVVRIDPRSLELCTKLKELPADADYDIILATTLDNFALSTACARKQYNSVKLLKEFSNYKDPK